LDRLDETARLLIRRSCPIVPVPRLRHLVGCQHGRQPIAQNGRVVVSLRRGTVEPDIGGDRVARAPEALGVQASQPVLGVGVALAGGGFELQCRRRVVAAVEGEEPGFIVGRRRSRCPSHR